MLVVDEQIIKTCCFVTKPQKGYRIIWEITSKCNYKCDFCFLGMRSRDLDLNSIKKIIDKLISSVDIYDILLAGREPFMRDDLHEIIQYIAGKNIKISLSTNGSFFEQINEILQYKNQIRSVNLSIYSHNPEINDRIYNAKDANTLAKIEKSVQYLLDADVDIKVNIPLIKNNLPDLLKTIEYVADLGVKRISILPITPIGAAKNLTTNECYDSMDFSNTSLYTDLLNLSNKYDLTITPLRMKLIKSQKCLEKCYAGIKFLSILPNGVITSCNLIHNSNNCGYYDVSSSLIDLDLNMYTANTKKFFVDENSKVGGLLCNNGSLNASCGGGCRAIIASERGNVIEKKPFEKFYDS